MCEHGKILGRVKVFKQIPHSPSLSISVPLGSDEKASLSSFTEFIFSQNETGSLKPTHYMALILQQTWENVYHSFLQLLKYVALWISVGLQNDPCS